MRLYNSFLVRCWVIRSAAEGERNVMDIEHIQTGDHFRPSNMSDAEGWMCETLHRSPAVAQGRVSLALGEDSGGEPEGV